MCKAGLAAMLEDYRERKAFNTRLLFVGISVADRLFKGWAAIWYEPPSINAQVSPQKCRRVLFYPMAMRVA